MGSRASRAVGGMRGIGLGLVVGGVLVSLAQYPLQQRGIPSVRYFLGQFGEGWFAELYPLPAGDSLWVGLLVRVPYSLLLFERSVGQSGFVSSIYLSVEFADTVGVVRKRLELRDTVRVQEYEATVMRDSAWVRGLVAMVPIQVVRCQLQLQLGQEVKRQELTMSTAPGVIRWSSPLVAMPGGDTVVVPFVLGSALPFGSLAARFVFWDARIELGKPYSYRCRQLPAAEGERWWDSVPELRGEIFAYRCGQLRIHRLPSGFPAFRFEPGPVCGWIELELPMAMAVPGRYELTLLRADTVPKDTLRWNFRILWATMPASLRHIPYAVQSMRYLLTDEEWERLRRGSSHEQWDKLWRYWKQRDPTPTTAYNEAMAVYFRRVDHAYFAFQSVTEPDGAQTDRGKVYILYGEPSRVERDFPPDDAPREVWIYDRFRKRFLFELRPDGRWRLVKVEWDEPRR